MFGARVSDVVDSRAFKASYIVEDTSKLISSLPLSPSSICKVNSIALQHGIELTHWFARFESPIRFPLFDDSGRVSFSFTIQLEGCAACVLDEGGDAYRLEGKTACIHYGPGRMGNYYQHGLLRNLTVTVHPDLFSVWLEDTELALHRILDSGGYLEGYRGGELFATAQLLSRELPLDGGAMRHPLWLQGQALALIGSMLEGSDPVCSGRERANETKRFYRARDRLLADLSCAPNLMELAKEVGLSISTLTRGFRKFFGNSPYRIFQQERMRVARLRLLSEDISVTSLAIDLGYTNVGHFSNAFRQQFGVLPSALNSRTTVSGSNRT